MKVIDAENPLDLSQEPSEQSEVSSRHSDKARYDLREELFVGKRDAGRLLDGREWNEFPPGVGSTWSPPREKTKP